MNLKKKMDDHNSGNDQDFLFKLSSLYICYTERAIHPCKYPAYSKMATVYILLLEATCIAITFLITPGLQYVIAYFFLSHTDYAKHKHNALSVSLTNCHPHPTLVCVPSKN